MCAWVILKFNYNNFSLGFLGKACQKNKGSLRGFRIDKISLENRLNFWLLNLSYKCTLPIETKILDQTLPCMQVGRNIDRL